MGTLSTRHLPFARDESQYVVMIAAPQKSRLRNRIKELRLARQWSLEKLGTRADTTRQQIYKLENGELRLSQEWMERLAKAFGDGIRPADLLPDQELKKTPGTASRELVASQNQSGLSFEERDYRSGPRDLPILGYVKAGQVGLFIDQGERQGVTVRPEALRDVRTAYAVRVHDTSMSPAFEPGYVLHVDPTRPVKAGDNVVIQTTDGQAFIKRLTRRTERVLICEQFNPREPMEFKPSKVRSIHMVVGCAMVEI
jgi:phage repressor protein C with HTH and peptisase S24 domain